MFLPPPAASLPRMCARGLRQVGVDFDEIPDTITGADGTSRCPPGIPTMNPIRRLSQAISEGDGISLLVPVDAVGEARTAEDSGA